MNALGASGSITAQNLAVTGNSPTSGSYVQIPQLDQTTTVLGISVSGTYTGALTPRGTVDGVTWFALGAQSILNLATGVSSATIVSAATGLYQVNVAGLQGFRLDAEAAFTGTAVVGLNESSAAVTVSSNMNPQWSLTAAQPQSNSDSVIKAAPGFLYKVLITATGTGITLIYDNATAGSGVVIGAIPANPVAGTVYTFNAPAAAGITTKGGANNCAYTAFYS